MWSALPRPPARLRTSPHWLRCLRTRSSPAQTKAQLRPERNRPAAGSRLLLEETRCSAPARARRGPSTISRIRPSPRAYWHTCAKTLNEVLLATRALKTRYAALRAEVTSSTETIDQRIATLASAYDLRIAALASAHDLLITALASRPSGLTASSL